MPPQVLGVLRPSVREFGGQVLRVQVLVERGAHLLPLLVQMRVRGAFQSRSLILPLQLFSVLAMHRGRPFLERGGQIVQVFLGQVNVVAGRVAVDDVLVFREDKADAGKVVLALEVRDAELEFFDESNHLVEESVISRPIRLVSLELTLDLFEAEAGRSGPEHCQPVVFDCEVSGEHLFLGISQVCVHVSYEDAPDSL